MMVTPLYQWVHYQEESHETGNSITLMMRTTRTIKDGMEKRKRLSGTMMTGSVPVDKLVTWVAFV